MRRGEKQARKAVATYLKNVTSALPVLLFHVAVMADRAVIPYRRGDLFSSLYDYECLMPEGYHCFWLAGPNGSATYVVGTEEQARNNKPPPRPGVFDAGVDMGPQYATH